MLHTYLIASGDLSSATVEEEFDECYPVYKNAWVIATTLTTCAEVADKGGLSPKGKRTGIVVKLRDYYGYFDMALWEKIEAWENLT